MTTTLSRAEPGTATGAGVLAVSMAIWAVVLVGVITMAPLDAAFSSDDGAYGIQVRSLADDGAWVLDRPVPVVPVANEGVVNGWRTAEGPVAYPNHPVYVQMLRAGTVALGEGLGLRVTVLVAALFVPLLAWKLADELELGWPLGAFWLTALSPLAVHVAGLWAHAPSAALATAALLVVARTRRRPVVLLDVALVAAALGVGVLVRREMLLWAVALLIGWMVLRWSRRTVVAVSVVAAAVAAAVIGERFVQSRLAGDRLASALAGNEPERWLTGQVGAAWHGLFDPSHVGGAVGLVAMLGALLVILGAVQVRRADVRAGAPWLIAGAAVLAVRVVVGDTELSTGIVTAWPLAVAGIIVGWRPDQSSRFLAGVVALFAAAVLVTQHPDGGGLEWGGRYFSPALAAVAVLASGGVARLWASGRLARTTVALTLTLPTLAGVLAADGIRERNADVVAAVDQLGTPVVITDQPALVRVAWATVPDTAWYRATEDDLDPLLDLLAEAEVNTLTVQGLTGYEIENPHYAVTEPVRGLRLLKRR